MGEWIKVTIKNPSKETLNIEPIILGTTMFFAFIILGLISIVIMAGFILSVNDHILTEKIQKEGND
jgi:hypothetical protein